MADRDNYLTLKAPSEALYKVKGSKFYGYAFPMNAEEELKVVLDRLKTQHHAARHHCYGYRINPAFEYTRANDDGEPSNAAGMPILNQILSENLYNVGVVVVRYFGGTKLGVPGMINAYKTGAKWAIEEGQIIEKTLSIPITIQCSYQHLNEVMRVIKREALTLSSQKMEIECSLVLDVPISEKESVISTFKSLHNINVYE